METDHTNAHREAKRYGKGKSRVERTAKIENFLYRVTSCWQVSLSYFPAENSRPSPRTPQFDFPGSGKADARYYSTLSYICTCLGKLCEVCPIGKLVSGSKLNDFLCRGFHIMHSYCCD